MDVKEKINLIKRNTVEIIGEEDLEKLLKKKKEPVCYLGTAPTGVPHVGYFIWGLKVADLIKAGFKVKILLADLHAVMDNTPWEILDKRYKFYSKIIPLMIQAMGADEKKLEFVKGSSFQLNKDYVTDLFKLSSLVPFNDCHRAASEVVKMGDSPKLSGYIYPLMQAIDEEYLKVDMQMGGTDQRKIFVLARERLPQLGYEKRIELMNPLLPGLIGKKMSSSVEASKISLLDDEKTVLKKLKSADFVEGNPKNGIMAFIEYILFTIKKDKNEDLVVERPEKFGGNLNFKGYEELEKAVVKKEVHPLDIKNTVAKEINLLLKGIDKNRDILEKLFKEAYPEK
jgi:tyrosyl-tRNA synthetase